MFSYYVLQNKMESKGSEELQAKMFLEELQKLPKSHDFTDFLTRPNFKDLNLISIVPDVKAVLVINGDFMVWLTNEVKNGNKSGLKIWNKIVITLGRILHQTGDGTAMLNGLLQVVEKAFKHEDSNMRIHAYHSWMVLMDNFALNPQMIVGPKRINLLIKPLVVCIFI